MVVKAKNKKITKLFTFGLHLIHDKRVLKTQNIYLYTLSMIENFWRNGQYLSNFSKNLF